MPQRWDSNKVAVEKEELCIEYWDRHSQLYQRAKKREALSAFWRTYNALKMELYRKENKPYGIKRLTYGGNGRRLLIDFDTLPPSIQKVLGDPRIVPNPLVPYYNIKPECIKYYSEFKRNGFYLNPNEQERYITNATTIEAALEYLPQWEKNRISLGGSIKSAYHVLLSEVTDFNKWLLANEGVTHNLPGSIRSFKKALKDFETNGYFSIIKDPYGKTRQNALKVDERVIAILQGLFTDVDIKPSQKDVADIYTKFKNGMLTVYDPETGESYNPEEYPELSPATIVRWLAKWESRVATHRKRGGNRQLYIGTMPHAQMDMPEYAGSILSIDDRQPPFWYEKGRRMWFYIGLDVASDCITTFVYGKTKEGIIIDFYRQMVRNYAEWGFGLPIELECESSLNSSFKTTFLQEGRMFEHVKIEANNAQAKIIERRFGELRNVNEKKHLGWIPRPHALAERNQTKPGKTPIIPYNQLAHDRLVDIENWNNTIHRNGEMTRWEYFQQNQHPNMKPINWTAILPYLGIVTKTSCHRGYIKLQGRARAIAENGKILKGEPLLNVMRQIEGKDITVYWLDANDGSILKALAYYKDRLVCEVMEMPRFNRAKAERTEIDSDAMALQMAYINTIQAYASTHAKEIIKLDTIDHTPKPERKFKISDVTRYEAKDDFTQVEVLEDMHEDDKDILYDSNNSSNSALEWSDTF